MLAGTSKTWRALLALALAGIAVSAATAAAQVVDLSGPAADVFSRQEAVNATEPASSSDDNNNGTSAAAAGPDQSVAAAPFPNSYYASLADEGVSVGEFNATSAPKYPSPWMDGSGGWEEAYARARDFVAQLTVPEKVNLTSGTGWQTESCVGQTGAIPRLGFRSLCMQDSPLGMRFGDYNSLFPAGGTVAASFDRKLWYERGQAMGAEFRDKGADVQLGPVVGPLGRSPEGGRGFEGFSPDPVLSGIAGAETVKGMQSQGVMATMKHFILNEQEHFRQVGEATGYGYNITEALSSNIDDATMHELYLWPFADAVRANVASVMCSYTQINNSYGCQNSYTMNHLLKGELGFQGFIMSDWQAQHAGIGGALAGLDMAMPGDTLFDTGDAFYGANLTIGVLNGSMPLWRLDDMATRIMAAYYLVGRDKHQIPINFNSWSYDTFGYQHYISQLGYGLINEHVDVRQEHGHAIRRMAARSTVLLKNVNKTLPLSDKEKFTAVFGSDAGDSPIGPNGCGDRGCDNGTLAAGWGSGSANFPYLVSPLSAIARRSLDKGNGIVQGILDDYAYDEITALAKQASVALVFVNADSGEGFISVDGNEGDRQNLTLWHGGEQLVRNVTASCNNTIVVVHSTGPVLLDGIHDNPNVTALVWAGLPGEQSGNSLVDVLYGDVNPAAKLPFTMGATRQDYGTDLLYKPNNGEAAPQDVYAEGPFIDYRAFDKYNKTPVYEFGYGLSYTKFKYSNLQVEQNYDAPAYKSGARWTADAPTVGGTDVGDADRYVFPANFTRQGWQYIYPFLNTTDLKAASGAPDYGADPDTWLPAGARNGSSFELPRAGGAPGGNPRLYDVLFRVTADVTNVGDVAGDDVVQLYVNLGKGPRDAKVALRGFDRLCNMQPGETRTFEANLTRRDLSYWNSTRQDWAISADTKTVYIGHSSRKLALHQRLPKAK